VGFGLPAQKDLACLHATARLCGFNGSVVSFYQTER
jgi:hypothetical protein